MFIGLDKNHNRISADRAVKSEEYFCPICRGKLRIKDGQIIAKHFAHVSLKECDDFTHDMSPWHREWQNMFPEENQEVVISLDINETDYQKAAFNWEFDYNGNWHSTEQRAKMFEDLNSRAYFDKGTNILHIQHRADVCIGEYVIEFQHSPISYQEFNKRNWFYTAAGYKLIWIFDLTDTYNNLQIKEYGPWEEPDDKGWMYTWSNPKKFLKNFIPQEKKNDIVLFFEFWSPEKTLELTQKESELYKYKLQKITGSADKNGYSCFAAFTASTNPKNNMEKRLMNLYQDKIHVFFESFIIENEVASMFIGLDKNYERVDVEQARKEEEYFCPICHGKLRIKDGQINAKHFAHVSLQDCDDFTADMSEWHRNWQGQFPEKNREVVLLHNEEKHRADVLACGYVIEFQQSPISIEEFDRRNAFYTGAGYKVVWIFDCRIECDCGQMECYDEWHKKNDNGGKWKWKNPRRFMRNFVPQEEKNIIVFFQIADADFNNDGEHFYLERVIWAIEEDGESNFRRFMTSYYPGYKTELLEQIKKRTL